MRLALFSLVLTLSPLSALAAAPDAPKLIFPVACEVGKTCEIQHYVDHDAGPGVMDYRCGHRTNDKHDGTDIRILDMAAQRAGVDVIAAAAGRVVAVRDGVPDISIRAPGAPSTAGHQCGNRVALQLGNCWLIDYCHLALGSLKVKLGDVVGVGQPLAHVGLSGDTEFAHLHFSVRHGDAVIDPFAPDMASGCATRGPALWTTAAAAGAPYKRGVVLNAGFSSRVVSMDEIEERAAPPVTAEAAGIVAFARMIGLEQGDVIDISLTGPDGKVLASATLPPLDHDKAQLPAEVGRKQPAGGWARGAYTGLVEVRRGGAVAVSRRWQMTL
jgi:hypothetical protein